MDTTHSDEHMVGRYRILGEIGKGGMGIVYKAHDPRIDRIVALKTIRPDRGGEQGLDAELLKWLLREARAAGKLSHPGIVTVYDVGEDAGAMYIAMEFVEGMSLRARLREASRLSVDEAARLAIHLCDALDYAHRRGVVHRDLKPDNVLCLADGSVKLADFGIARVASLAGTQTVTPMGTPRYMAPEQWRGEAVDARTDLFSLGVVLYELVTGTPPFRGQSASELMYQVLNEAAPLPSVLDPDLPHELDTIVRRALARNPRERYASAEEMGRDLRALLRRSPPQSVEPVRLTLLRRGDMHLIDLGETDTLIPRSETRVDSAFLEEIVREVERLAPGRGITRGEASGPGGTTVAEPRDDCLAELKTIGALIYSQLLTEPARRKLRTTPATELYLRLDERLVQVPWELCFDGHDFLALKFRVARQVITERALAGNGERGLADEGRIEVLIVADPTGTLPAAIREAEAIEAELAGAPAVHVTRMEGRGVRKLPLLRALGRSSFVHFAGHSVYDPEDPTRSGWMLSDGVLTAGEMAKLDRLPALVFSNSCHAAATVGWDGRSAYEGQAFGIGSAFLLAGVRNYIGAVWVAHDEESARFARAFYEDVLRGATIGAALQASRRRSIAEHGWNQLTWASYMLYGDPLYRLPIQRAESAPSVVPAAVSPSPTASSTPRPATGSASGARRAVKRAIVTGAAVLSLAAAAAGWYLSRPPVPMPPPVGQWAERPVPEGPVGTSASAPSPAPAPPVPPTPAPLPKSYADALNALNDKTISQDTKLGLVREMSADASDEARRVLESETGNPSLLVSMAAIQGLKGRPCELIGPPLAALLDADAWQRRAWAAKVLGESQCRAFREKLSGRERREPDRRVHDALKRALEML